MVWVGAWAHDPTAYNLSPPASLARPDGSTRLQPAGYSALPPYRNETVREIVRLSAASSRLRLRLSNEFGDRALHLGSVHIALASDNDSIIGPSDHIVTFAGLGSVIIPPGAPLLSDPVDWQLPAFTRLSVSVFYPEDAVPPAHTLFTLKAYAAPGDLTTTERFSDATAARTGNHLSEIDIVPKTARHCVVAFGDSITEGVVSTPGAFHSWPDRLAERLAADPATRQWAVVNAGIGSNRLLHDTPSTNALARFDRDVLSVPGISIVIVLLGVNDIQYSHRFPYQAVTSAQMIAALRQLIVRAHEHGIRIIGGTITAFQGSPDYTEQGEAVRQAVNNWIRVSKAFDGVADFDSATRDPAQPTRLLAGLESNGHLHPNDAGYAAMSTAVGLHYFTRPSPCGNRACRFAQVLSRRRALQMPGWEKGNER